MDFKKITLDSKEYPTIESIYDEAFPEIERMGSMKAIVKYSELNNEMEVVAVLENDVVVGFYVTLEVEGSLYLLFFAVNHELRGGGYGSKILKSLLSNNPGRVVFGLIESPDEPAENSEQRLKRKKFYDRNGLPMTDNKIYIEGEGNYNIIVNNLDVDSEHLTGVLNPKMDEVTKELNRLDKEDC